MKMVYSACKSFKINDNLFLNTYKSKNIKIEMNGKEDERPKGRGYIPKHGRTDSLSTPLQDA